jgi:SpoVK/Ycf46/Vps4 family AAA+-type ATPase
VFKSQTGRPSILFIDEAESILSRRGSGISSDVEKTIVPTFLTEMDGISKSDTIVILVTNRPDMLDEAVIREGRIDKRILIDYPILADQLILLNQSLANVVFKDKKDKCFEEAELLLGKYGSKCSGAKIVTISQTIKQLAARRDSQSRKVQGLVVDDVTQAVRRVLNVSN